MMSAGKSFLFLALFLSVLAQFLSRLFPQGDRMVVSSSRFMSSFANNSGGRGCFFPPIVPTKI